MKKVCSKCGIEKDLCEFQKDKKYSLGYKNYCNKCRLEYHREYQKEYRKRNKASIAEYKRKNKASIAAYNRESRKKYRLNNKEKISKEKKKYRATKLLRCPQFKINLSISKQICVSLKGNKNGHHWESLVGYTLNELINHIEKQFTEGMSWENYGKWHLDHRIPKSAFNFSKPSHIDFKKYWALSNLQPLWAKDNLRKHAKRDGHFQPSLKLAL